MNNPFNLFKMIKNPKEFALNMINKQNNPMLNNLVQMAEKGDKQGLEQFARNMYKEQGRDFDKEIASLKDFLK